MNHQTIYREPGMCGGWPANNGAWQWGDELLVGFTVMEHKKQPLHRHQVAAGSPESTLMARSLDGGETWEIDEDGPAFLESQASEIQREPMDFHHPDFAMTLRMKHPQGGATRLFYSYDRGRFWDGPWLFPMFGERGIMARTDYIVLGRYKALVFLTASKRNGREGRPLCAVTENGGVTWNVRGWIGGEIERGFAIMPSTIMFSDGSLLTAVRVSDRREPPSGLIAVFRSNDEGRIWEHWPQSLGIENLPPFPVAFEGERTSTPPDMKLFADGRLCIVFGRRLPPYAIQAVLSDDQGWTWTDPITIRQGAACWDFGYPRTLQRSDGKMVTVYYWCETEHGERTIESTIWEVPECGS